MTDDKVAPDHEALNKELAAELLDARGRLLSASKQAQASAEHANSLSAMLDEARKQIVVAEQARRQAEGNLVNALDAIPPYEARIARLEADLRVVVDALQTVHDKAQAVRPE